MVGVFSLTACDKTVRTSSIAVSVYLDANDNTQKEELEKGLSGINVTLNNDEGEEFQLLTNDMGQLVFEDLAAGNYSLTLGDAPNNEVLQGSSTLFNIVLNEDEAYVQPDFRYVPQHNVQLYFNLKQGANDVELNEAYVNSFNQRFELEKMLFYFCHFNLVKANGDLVPLTEVGLYNFAYNDLAPSKVLATVPEGEYVGLQFGLGLDAALNASDPNMFEQEHPLSYYQNNYWTWSTKYIFVKLEGRIDENIAGSDYASSFLYHLGQDEAYRTVALDNSLTVNNAATAEIAVAIDIDKLFNDADNAIDMFNDNVSHSTGDGYELALKIMDNLAAAFVIEN